MAEHNELGQKGEELAREYLERNGYTIEAVNWRFGQDELDIIAKTKGFIVFAEVKSRKSLFAGDPETAVTLQKQRFIIRAANAYIEKNNITLEARFDIIAIIFTQNDVKINHIKDAFYPLLRK